jgi:hypothetical protein
MLDTIMQGVRYAVRALRSSPGFAAVAILSLALGIGANTAIFSLIDSLMLKALPVSRPERLLQVTIAKDPGFYFSKAVWDEQLIRDHAQPNQTIFVGVIDPINARIETPEEVRDRVMEAAEFIPLQRLGTTDDCGFAPFSDDSTTGRATAFEKIRARVVGSDLASKKLAVWQRTDYIFVLAPTKSTRGSKWRIR